MLGRRFVAVRSEPGFCRRHLCRTAATATPPVGDCPDDYGTLTRAAVENLPDAALALAAFDAVNANGDAVVCYKPYRNGPHNGHYGNFIDNTAAPHH